ncbi:MAG: hypothetical protein KAV82_06640 [Phycisphaerae bacterium]|nr:hypothetical protein [Phycisphaerae bacterium]
MSTRKLQLRAHWTIVLLCVGCFAALTSVPAWAVYVPLSEAESTTVPTVDGDGFFVEIFLGIGGGTTPLPSHIAAMTPDADLLSPRVDFPHPGSTVSIHSSFEAFFADTVVPPDAVRLLQPQRFILRTTTLLKITEELDRNTSTPEIDIQIGIGCDDGHYLMVGNQFLGSSPDHAFRYYWYSLEFEGEGLYPVYFLFAANAAGVSGLELSWNTAPTGSQIVPQSYVYQNVPGCSTEILFEEYPAGTAVTDQYRDLGAVFEVLGGDLQITDAKPTEFVPVSVDRVFGDPNADPLDEGLLELRFVVPGTDTPGATNIFTCYVIDAEETGATITAYDIDDQELFFGSYNAGGATQELVEILATGIHRVVFTLGQGADTSALDNLCFNPPYRVIYPDLEVTDILLPESGLIGTAYEIGWVVINSGGYPAEAPWVDRVYISPDAEFGNGNDTPLGDFTHNDDLDLSESYVRNEQFTLPSVPGEYWIIIETDANHNVNENLNEDNNVLISPDPIIVQTPDLVVDSVVVAEVVYDGEPAEIAWTVLNNGNGQATGPWLDRIYLSEDAQYDAGVDELLGEFEQADMLDAYDTYTRTEEVIIPPGLNGNYYVIVITDAANAVTEYGGEDNNITATETQIQQLELPDFEITQFFTSDDHYVGQTFAVSWVVENTGPGTANGSWMDRVYLSDDDQLDTDPTEGDPMMSQHSIVDIIGPSGLYMRTASFDLPETAGDYWIFIVVDALETIREEDDTNNVEIIPLAVLAPEYSATVQADIETGVIGTPVTLSGVATWLDGGEPAPEVNVDIRLILRDTRRVFRVETGLDGSFSYVFTPLGDEAGVYSVSADHPVVEDPAPEDQFILYGMKANPVGRWHNLVVGTVANSTVQLRNLGDTPLTGLTFEVTGLPANLELEVTAPAGLDPQASATIEYTLNALDSSIPSANLVVTFTTTEGATATLSLNVNVRNPLPVLVADPDSLSSAMLRGERTFVEFVVTNIGGAATGELQVQLPATDWLGLASPQTFGPLQPSESATVVLQLDPADDLVLGPYTGSLVVSGSQCGVAVSFEFTAISDAVGDLRVEVTDEYTYYAEGSPRVADATVTVISLADGYQETLITDDTGIVLFVGLTEAHYDITVTAPEHGRFATTLLVPASNERQIEAFLPRQAVSYEWTVEPIDIEDNYEIVIEAEFETNVPMPVVTIDPPLVDLTNLESPFLQIDFTITNHGFIQADAARLLIGEHPRYNITPLIDDLGDLPAQSTIVVPVIIEDTEFGRNPEGRDGECVGVRFELAYDLICGIPITYLRPVFFNLPPEECPGSPGTGGGWIAPAGGPGGPGGGGDWTPIVTNPTYVTTMPCDPCDVACAVAILDCAIGFVPGIGCPWGLMRSCSGMFGPIDPISCGLTIAGCIPGIGVVPGIISCIYGIGGACWCLVEGGEPGRRNGDDFFPPLDDEDISDPKLAYYIEHANRQLAFLDYAAYLYGDDNWLYCPPEEQEVFEDWITLFQDSVADGSEQGNAISTAEHDAMLAQARPSHLTTEMINLFIERWNRTIDYWDQGIHTTDQVPQGWNTDFIDQQVQQAKLQRLMDAIDADEAEGFSEFMQSAIYGQNMLLEDLTEDTAGFCAQVTIQISQQAVVTRSAFQATLALDNTGDVYPLDNVAVEIFIKDQNGVLSNDLFGVLDPEVTGGLSAVDGTQSLGTLNDMTAQWVIVPSNDAAPVEPTVYYVSGQMSYIVEGEEVNMPLFPVAITVHPNPILHFDYFLEKIVYSDDPFTEGVVEPAVPFALGLLVRNEGAGEMKNLRITSAQPEIIENEYGLLIDFTIIGTQVGYEERSPSLTVDFGALAPSEGKVARWWMTSTLQGEFTQYSATFEQTGPLGELGLTLIESLEIHEMNHVVRIDDPQDDGLPDFLTNDTPDMEDLPDQIHSSDGEILPVTAVTEGVTDGSPTPGDLEVQLTVTMPSGWAYIRVDDPAAGDYRLIRVVRSDGREVRIGDNAWTTHRIIRPGVGDPYPEDLLHLVDLGGTGSYTLTYAPWTPAAPTLGQATATTVPLLDAGTVFEGSILHAVYEETTGKYVGLDGLLTDAAQWQTLDDWAGTVVWALTPETEYRFKSKAHPTGGDVTDFGPIGTATTTIPGDASGDSSVTLTDKLLVETAFGSRPGQPNWDPRCDLNGDHRVTTRDRRIVQLNMTKSSLDRNLIDSGSSWQSLIEPQEQQSPAGLSSSLDTAVEMNRSQ